MENKKELENSVDVDEARRLLGVSRPPRSPKLY